VRARGFSIAEALIAFGLVATTVIVLFHIFPATRKAHQLSENRINATSLGYSLLQGLRNTPFDSIGPSSGSYEIKGVNNGAPFSQLLSYRIDLQPSADGNLKQVWVTLTWHEATGDKTAVIETLILKAGN
jgi:Tfp pilus assembly protein PilV